MGPDFLGTLPGWLTVLFSAGTFGIAVKLILGWRGQNYADEADIRDHYAQEVAAMREQMMKLEKHYRDMLEQSDRRHDECEKARRDMREQLEGLKAQLRSQAADRVLALEERCAPPSENVLSAARRVKKIVEDGDGGVG